MFICFRIVLAIVIMDLFKRCWVITLMKFAFSDDFHTGIETFPLEKTQRTVRY